MGTETDERTVTTEEREVTEDALAAAFAKEDHELTEEEKVTVEKAKEVMTPGEFEAHREKSRLGRKFKTLEAELAELKETVKKSKEVPVASVVRTEIDDSEVDDTAERDRIKELFYEDPIEANRQLREFEEKKEKAKTRKFETAYLGQIESSKGKESEELRDEIYNEIFEHRDGMVYVKNQEFNKVHTGNPVADAQINWANAKAAVLSRYAAEGKKPAYKGAGDRTAPPVGAAGTPGGAVTTETVVPKYEGKLAAYAKYLRGQGLSEEEIAERCK